MPAVLQLARHTNAQARLKRKMLPHPVTERRYEAPSCSCSLLRQGLPGCAPSSARLSPGPARQTSDSDSSGESVAAVGLEGASAVES